MRGNPTASRNSDEEEDKDGEVDAEDEEPVDWELSEPASKDEAFTNALSQAMMLEETEEEIEHLVDRALSEGDEEMAELELAEP